MKVLFDHQIFASQVYGGISRYFVEIGSRIAAMPDTCAEVLCPLYVNALLAQQHAIRVHGRRVARLPHSAIAMRATNALLSTFFRQARGGTSIYHETYFSRIDLAPKGAARVVTVHDMVHEKFPGSFPGMDRTIHAKRAAILRADHVICVSENTRRDLLDAIAVDPARVSTVYHGSSMHAAHGTGEHRRKPQLLYVGGRRGYKNFPALMLSFARSRLRDSGFSLLCFGGGNFASDEVAIIEGLGLARDVHYTSGDDDALRRAFMESTALVYPSLYEGFGIPVLEAMSCGCPVICSNTSSLPEVAGSAAAYFDPSDLDAMQASIESVAFSSDRASELMEAGYIQSAKFSWDRSAAETMSAYRSVRA